MMMSSTSSAGTLERLSASPIDALASSNTSTSASDPLRAVPMAVRAAETMTASGIGLSLRASSHAFVRDLRGAYLTPESVISPSTSPDDREGNVDGCAGRKGRDRDG